MKLTSFNSSNEKFRFFPHCREQEDEEIFWKLSHRESSARMRLKLVPSLNHDNHKNASNLRDNTTQSVSKRFSTDLSSTLAPAIFGEEGNDEEIVLLEEEIRNAIESEA